MSEQLELPLADTDADDPTSTLPFEPGQVILHWNTDLEDGGMTLAADRGEGTASLRHLLRDVFTTTTKMRAEVKAGKLTHDFLIDMLDELADDLDEEHDATGRDDDMPVDGGKTVIAMAAVMTLTADGVIPHDQDHALYILKTAGDSEGICGACAADRLTPTLH